MDTNPDTRLLRAFLSDGTRPVAVDTNPLAAALGATLLRFDSAEGRLSMAFTPGDLFRQGAGFVQGGALGCMLDFAMAFAALVRLPADAVVSTAGMTLSLVAGARSGRTLHAEGIVERAGRSLVFTRAELRGEDTTLVASATSILAVRCGAGAPVAAIPA